MRLEGCRINVFHLNNLFWLFYAKYISLLLTVAFYDLLSVLFGKNIRRQYLKNSQIWGKISFNPWFSRKCFPVSMCEVTPLIMTIIKLIRPESGGQHFLSNRSLSRCCVSWQSDGEKTFPCLAKVTIVFSQLKSDVGFYYKSLRSPQGRSEVRFRGNPGNKLLQ